MTKKYILFSTTDKNLLDKLTSALPNGKKLRQILKENTKNANNLNLDQNKHQLHPDEIIEIAKTEFFKGCDKVIYPAYVEFISKKHPTTNSENAELIMLNNKADAEKYYVLTTTNSYK